MNILEKGKSNHFDSILKRIPQTVYQLMNIPGIGQKRLIKLVTSLGLTNKDTLIEDLKKACQEGRSC